jgi:hypothetical protein
MEQPSFMLSLHPGTWIHLFVPEDFFACVQSISLASSDPPISDVVVTQHIELPTSPSPSESSAYITDVITVATFRPGITHLPVTLYYMSDLRPSFHVDGPADVLIRGWYEEMATG